MGKPHGQGRYAALSCVIAGLRAVQLSTLLSGILLVYGSGAYALDTSLDVSQYAHTAWKVRDGFAKGAIFSIAQTPDGYLWLGTEFGLFRFDGVRAVPWHPPGDEQLPNNFINHLLVSRDGALWIGTHRGLARWKDGKFTKYPELAGLNVFALLENHEGIVWIGGYGQPAGKLCAGKGPMIQCYGAGQFGQGVTALYEDHKGNLWVSATTGLWRWTPGLPDHYPLPRGVIAYSLIEDDSGVLLLGTPSGLNQLVDGKVEGYSLPGVTGHVWPQRFLRTTDGSLWVSTLQGLLHLHQGRVDGFRASDGLSADFVTPIFEDREGNVWVGTQDGLDRFRELAVPTISRNEGLSNSAAWSVQASADGSIWIGTADGLNRWENGPMTVYRSRKALGQGRQEDKRELSNIRHVNEITNSGLTGDTQSLGQDARGRLWTSTSDGVFYFEGGRFIRIHGVPGGFTYSIAGDRYGKVWISNFHGGVFYWSEGHAVQQIPRSRLGEKHAIALLPDRLQGGGLWLGFDEGGIAYLKDGQVRASYNAADGLGNGQINGLRFGSRGALWAETEGGLSRIEDGHIATLTSKNGLPCDAVHWSVEDDDHAVWLYMPCGLVRIARSELDAWVSDPKRTIQTTVFDISDGVRSPGIAGGYPPRVTKSSDGRIWFLPRDGVSVIDPRHLPINKIPPPVHVEQIVADRKIYWQNWSGDLASPPRLPPLVRDLTIDYTALSLVVPEKVRFRVKLEGWDRDWKDAANERKAFYSNLPPRKYRFRVMACNNSGVWNEAGTFLDFSIAPAYWQANWFRALCVAAFMVILWAAYRLRVGVLEERQALLEQQHALSERHEGEVSALTERLMKAQEEERIRIAGELHDGVLQQLTSLALQLGTATLALPPNSEPKAEVSEVEKKLIQVGAEIRQLSHELHPAALHEKGLPDALSSYCEEFSATRGIPISYQADERVEKLSPGAALCIYRIAQEALGNVAKHAQAKHVQVRLSRTDGRVCLVITDDGIGFNPEGSGKSGGLGLINMRERVRQLNGTFEFESEPGRGTTVKAEVPFRPAS